MNDGSDKDAFIAKYLNKKSLQEYPNMHDEFITRKAYFSIVKFQYLSATITD